MKRDLYADVTRRILAELESGAAPWVKLWSATPGMNHPHNVATVGIVYIENVNRRSAAKLLCRRAPATSAAEMNAGAMAWLAALIGPALDTERQAA